MIRAFVAAAAVLVLSPLALSGPATAQQAGSFTIRFQPAVILDALGFEQPMAAATVFIPYGWRAQGGVVWNAQFACTNGYVFNWSATSPDGSMAVAVLPQAGWQSNNYGVNGASTGCVTASFRTAQQYLQAVVQHYRPDAHMIDYRPRPDLTREFAQLNSRTPTAMGEIQKWVDGGELLFGYNDHGRDMRGTISAVVVITMSRMANPAGGEVDALSGSSFPAFVMTAPAGQLNFAIAEAIRQSIQPSPPWLQRITNHNAYISNMTHAEIARRSQIVSQNSEEIAQIQHEAWAASQKSADQAAQDFDMYIRGHAMFTGPDGQPVELNNGGNTAWKMPDGTYVFSNDPNFNGAQAGATRLTQQ